MSIASLRREYMGESLDEADVAADPFVQFQRWFDEALRAELPMPNAMTLATATAEGAPSARIVLLKGIDHDGFVFYTNYLSRKGRELANNPRAALLFHWTELEREVRIEGGVERVSADESDEYFASRPLGSRHAAIASPQSEPVANRAALERKFAEVAAGQGDAAQRPAHWGGYRLRPAAVEFWQGRPNRLHDRLLYTLQAGHWTLGRLAP
ncbi:MAG: pyridoxamine 5'-phosphate oxidase [Burkholderiales bacterium]|nr:pyridoxamine 5'-phosphate oxidase [Burkholderiales bacterium]